MKIAKTSRIRKTERGWIVPSRTQHGTYRVDLQERKCNCPDFEKRGILGIWCKHLWAVEIIVKKIKNEDGSEIVTKAIKVTYSQDWSAYDEAQTKEKGLFLELLNDLCGNIRNPVHIRGRPRKPLADMVFCSALKVYTTFSLRRFISE